MNRPKAKKYVTFEELITCAVSSAYFFMAAHQGEKGHDNLMSIDMAIGFALIVLMVWRRYGST